MTDLTQAQQDQLDAAAFRRLLSHLDANKDVQNIDLMILSGFCRNCLSKWYKSAADDAGIVVFTIGYDISVSTDPNSPYVQMRDCASTPGHFYRVGVDDLDAAFASIAQTIQKLKLTN